MRAESLRATRQRVLSDLATGELTLTSLFEEASADSDVAMIRTLAVLESVPGWGKVAVRRTMAALGVGERVALGDLDDAQRERLVEAFA